MIANKEIVITGMAAISAVGLDVEQTCASIRAGISSFSDHPDYYPEAPNPSLDESELAVTASVPVIDPLLSNSDRLMELIIPSLTSLISETKLKSEQFHTGGLFLALPQQDEAVNSWSLESTFIAQLYKRTGLNVFKVDKINQLGNAGMFTHIVEAISLLHSGELDFCIIGGVDSYLLDDRMACLDNSWRLKSARNVDGYIPGEAASILLLETADHARLRNCNGLATILSSESSKESQTISSDKNSSGTGLCEAIEKALNKRNNKSNIQWVLCDLNGESYRSFEWGLVLTRLNALLSEIKEVSHPADCLGDIGAATGGILIASAVQALKSGYNIADEALLWTASDDGHRAALCVNQCNY